LIGEVSDWLVASDITGKKLQEVLGIELVQLDYDKLPDYLSFPADEQFLKMFTHLTAQHSELGSISSFLKDTLDKHHLDALTIQCFKMVREKHVTACLPVALCNYNGIPAGCEGDITSIVSIMLVKELTGQIAWMANMAAVHPDSIFMAHCTVPVQLASSYEIMTHYETDESAALAASMDLEEVTIFRMSNNLDKAFVAEGVIIDRPSRPGACRTQIEVSLSKDDISKLVESPLGNHHLVIKGHVGKLLRMAMASKNIKLI
jgi:L-fucose isomerase-like protein